MNIDVTKIITAEDKAAQKLLDQKNQIQTQINQIEFDTQHDRGSREGWITLIRKEAAAVGITDDATIVSKNPFFARLIEVDNQVRALRAQL